MKYQDLTLEEKYKVRSVLLQKEKATLKIHDELRIVYEDRLHNELQNIGLTDITIKFDSFYDEFGMIMFSSNKTIINGKFMYSTPDNQKELKALRRICYNYFDSFRKEYLKQITVELCNKLDNDITFNKFGNPTIGN